MDTFTHNALEFDKILSHLSSFCRSEAGKQEALQIRPIKDFNSILHLQKVYDEYATWKTIGDFHLIDFPDISTVLLQISSHSFHPEGEDFWAFREVLKLSRNAIISIRLHEKELPHLAEKVNFSFAEKSLSALTRCIADDATFKDESSPALLLIRNEIRALHQNCLRKVKEYTEQYNIAHYLQDDYMTIVGDRYVLPLKANFKGRLQGIIHDYSKTGETLYFEPLFVVELNNQLQELKQQEREEQHKIIKFLTELIIEEFTPIQSTWRFLLDLDLNEAKLGLANAYYPSKLETKNTNSSSFHKDIINKTKSNQSAYCVPHGDHLSLINAKHPLLLLENHKALKPINIQGIDLIFRTPASINSSHSTHTESINTKTHDKILVISGGNAGGKTVALKTLGLITIMSLCALPVPVNPASCLLPWTNIHAFIGDEQSLDDHVSTFTGQIRHLAQIWDSLDESHLVLLDEFGAGTDPSQGAALAQAVLDGMLEKNCYAISATHFPALKTYALTKSGVRAASVLFDSTTKKPLFHLAYDQVGASQALDVAKEHGLCESILKQASQYLLIDNDDTDRIMTKLNALSVTRENEIAHLQKEILKTKEKRTLLQERFEKEKHRLEIELREKSQELMRAWKTEKITAKQAMKEISALRASVQKNSSSHPSLNEYSAKEQQVLSLKDLSIGMEIMHMPWQKKGSIQELDDKGERAKINLGGISMWVSLKDIATLEESQENSKKNPKTQTGNIIFSRPNTSYTLDLRGKRADLALAELTQFLDSALLSGLDQVEIIHGRGTGALRKSVHQFLKSYPNIAHYTLATEEQGGDGMTIVAFK